MKICFTDSQYRKNLLPFTFTRPTAEIRVGIFTIREKWERFFPNASFSYQTESYLQKLFPSIKDNENQIIINGSVIPTATLAEAIQQLKPNEIIVDNEEEILAYYTSAENTKPTEFRKISISNCRKIKHKHHIYLFNSEEIQNDFRLVTAGRNSYPLSSTCQLIGDPTHLFIEEGAKVECCNLNCSNGFIYIGKDAEIMEGSSLRGNIAIMEHAQVKMGTRIYDGTTIGPHCRVGGEVSNIVMFAYSNKGHDGFLGNSVIGEWCNLGAGTNASNLKNNYGNIRQYNYATQTYDDTGLQFCGIMMGDHTKCGIGTHLNTATVIGIASQLFGTELHSNFIPSFSFGNSNRGYTTLSFDKIIESEKAMMTRRNHHFSETYCELLRTLYQLENS